MEITTLASRSAVWALRVFREGRGRIESSLLPETWWGDTQSSFDFPACRAAFNILVAEDNEDDLVLLRQAFKKAEVTSRLHHVSDGVEAMAYLQGEGVFSNRAAHPFPDIFLMDLNMPRKNGFEVLEWIRQDDKCSRLVVHVMTSSSRDADVRRAYDLHANTFLLKPSRVDELVKFVTTLHQWHRFVCLLSPQGNQSEKLVAQCGLNAS